MILLEPKTITIEEPAMEEGKAPIIRNFIISKYPALAGREIVTQYLTSGLPKIGDYKRNEELAIKSLSYAAVVTPAGELRLSNRDLIENHVGSFETCLRLEWAMLEYNCSFFRNGRASSFLKGIAQTIKQSGTQMLMDLLAQLWEKNKPPTKS